MAGDWIKMRTDLLDDPNVFKLSGLTKLDRLAVVGRLYAFWAWADKHAVDGRVDGAASTVVDDITRHDGFADALVAVNWIEIGPDYVELVKHDRHNGESAKERSMKNARQARWRENKAAAGSARVDGEASTSPSTQPTTREEKRREEKKSKPKTKASASPAPPGLPDWMPLESWQGYLDMRIANKKAATALAIERILKALDAFREQGMDVAAILDKSIINNWTDVYPLRDDRRAVPRPGQAGNLYDANQAAVTAYLEKELSNAE